MAKQTFTTGQVLTAAEMTSLQQTALGGGATTAKVASYVLIAADAGTVVQMNAAGATTITVNTALFAAGDSVQIQNIGAGVCTVTAGTATVSTAGSLALSQYEGGQLYFNTTSAALFFDIVQSSGMTNPMTTTGDIIYSSSGSTPARLGIGTTGQVLNVASGLPAWATPSSGSTVKVNYANPSGDFTSSSSSAVDITGYTTTFTPTSATNKIIVSYNLTGTRSATDSVRIIVDIGGVTQSLKAQYGSGSFEQSWQGFFVMTNIAASSTTVKLRVNPGGTSMTFYGSASGFVGQNITVMEIY